MRGPDFFYTSSLIVGIFITIVFVLMLANAALNGGF